MTKRAGRGRTGRDGLATTTKHHQQREEKAAIEEKKEGRAETSLLDRFSRNRHPGKRIILRGGNGSLPKAAKLSVIEGPEKNSTASHHKGLGKGTELGQVPWTSGKYTKKDMSFVRKVGSEGSSIADKTTIF